MEDMGFEQWLAQVPGYVKGEKFWQVLAYQKGLFLYELLWKDTEAWMRDERGKALARQIIASADSICANVEEGFGRGFGKQLIYFYTVSLGSARETKGRIYRARYFYAAEVLDARLKLVGEVVALLITEINRQKQMSK